jgi:hypothetical protein
MNMDKEKMPGKEYREDQHKGPEPNPETLHTTDPQEHMKGPVSSTMHNLSEVAKKNDQVSKEEASRRRDGNL